MPLRDTMKHENVIARRGAPKGHAEGSPEAQSPACEGGDCFASLAMTT